jgi:hypothetical protein
MAWESRNGRGRYYTRSRRENGRVVREYIGQGRVAEMTAELDCIERDEREARRRAVHLAREEIAAQDAPVKALHDDVEALARATLLVAGFHRHKGEWRRCRG